MSDEAATIWFEDMPVGRVDRFGTYAVTRDEVIAFATAYDPQPFHISDAAAEANPWFGRLAASGWHTACMGMRMTADYWASQGGRTILGGAGIRDLQWVKPVYPGDTLRCVVEVTEARPSRSKPHLGLVTARTEVLNQHEVVVLRQVSTIMMRRREG